MGNKVGKQKMGNKPFAAIWGSVLALVLIVVLVANFLGNKYETLITRSLGQTTTKVVATETKGDNEYFKSDFATHDEMVAHQTAFSRDLEAEGIVLMKNEHDSLPLKAGARITLLGTGTKLFQYGGGGSGAIDETKVMKLKPAFEAEGFVVNPEVWSMYEKADVKLGKNDISPDTYSSAVKASMAEYNDAAVLVISRSGHEANDIDEKFQKLNADEIALVEYADQNFDNIIVLLNTPNPIAMGWLDSYEHVNSCMWVGFPGQEGIPSIPQAISGKVNPSGRLVDTYAYDTLSAPAAQIYGSGTISNATNDTGAKKYYTVYGENIYVGYRYYETRYEDVVLGQGNAASAAGMGDAKTYDYSKVVQFPFGYGLSYTTFAYSDFSLKENADSFTVTVTVKNTGSAAGKEVVEVYFQSPYTAYDRENLIEKSAVELCGFAKTDILAPGGSETVSVEIPKEVLRTYDSKGAGTYIVDEGTYYFSVGRNAHEAINNILAAKGKTVADGMDADGDVAFVGSYVQDKLDTTTYKVDSKTGTEIVNRFDNGSITYYDDSYVYLTRNDWEGTWPKFYGTPDKKGKKYSIEASEELLHDSQENLFTEDPDAVMPTFGSGQNINLITMRGKDYDDENWEMILDCLTLQEMLDMVRLGGWQTMAIDSIGKPMSSDQDGPAGISGELIMSNVACMGYPNQMVLASTWNTALSEEFGKCIGEDGLGADVQGWYAPGAGMHRSNYGGRNFEYYSEDSFLSGAMCAAEVKGAQSKGMYVYLKHMALNDQEDHRYGINTFATEQAIREFYLKPFEMAVKQADCHGIMAAFNGIGGIWCGANKALMTDVLRNEWGFHGIVVTDYATANGGYMWMDMGTQAGADLWLNSDEQAYSGDTSAVNATYAQALRRACHDILYTVVNSAAMNGIDESVQIVKVAPQWKVWLYWLDGFIGVMTLAGVYMIVRRCKKNKV